MVSAKDKSLINRATTRNFVCFLATVAMLAFTIFCWVTGSLYDGAMWLWLLVLALWVFGVPTRNEMEALARIENERKSKK